MTVDKMTRSPSRRVYTHNPYRLCISQINAISGKHNNNNNNSSNTSSCNISPARSTIGSTDLAAAASCCSLSGSLSLNLDSSSSSSSTFINHECDTLHKELLSKVTFVPYPTDSFDINQHYEEQEQKEQEQQTEEKVRLFIGQLPYKVTVMQLQWLFFVFGGKTTISDPERITKKDRQGGGVRRPTGCIHAHITENRLPQVIEGMHKRILVDDTGVWYARTQQEKQILDNYVQFLKAEPRRRPEGMPYDTMVVSEAVSTFQPPAPRWVSNNPECEKFAPSLPPKQQQQQQNMVGTLKFGNNYHHNNHCYNNNNGNSSLSYPRRNSSNNSNNNSMHYNNNYYQQEHQPPQPVHHHFQNFEYSSMGSSSSFSQPQTPPSDCLYVQEQNQQQHQSFEEELPKQPMHFPSF